ncbi:MAG: FAD-dependent oxidoreductase [Pseudohongiellaceae bacterium]
MQSIAIIGAGAAGLSLASSLANAAEVRVFEKSRGLGGRLANRRLGDAIVDHGAQFFTARHPGFQALLERATERGDIAPWQARVLTLAPGNKPYRRVWFEPHYVGVPAMNALTRLLAENVNIALQARVSRIERHGGRWRLRTDSGDSLGSFDWVVSAAPAPQTEALLPATFTLRDSLRRCRFSACIALVLNGRDLPLPHCDAAVVRQSPLAWLARHRGRPGRQGDELLLLHSSNAWADDHIDASDDSIRSTLLAALSELFDFDAMGVDVLHLQRWRLARVEAAADRDYLLDPSNRLAACGDWCRGDRVEDAFLSGRRLADAMTGYL